MHRFRLGAATRQSTTTGILKEPVEQEKRGREDVQFRVHFPKLLSKSALDPFFPLCIDLPVSDLNLLHYCQYHPITSSIIHICRHR